jgi:hypothetical protein
VKDPSAAHLSRAAPSFSPGHRFSSPPERSAIANEAPLPAPSFPASELPPKLPAAPVLKFGVSSTRSDTLMLFSKEYVGYLARQVVKRLQVNHFIQTHELEKVIERVQSSMVEELSLEDRINDEVRVILDAYSDEMRKSAANYQEMFKRVKNELVKKYKAVL